MEGVLGWKVSIENINHRDDFLIPVLQYRWGMEGGLTEGYVRFWPMQTSLK